MQIDSHLHEDFFHFCLKPVCATLLCAVYCLSVPVPSTSISCVPKYTIHCPKYDTAGHCLTCIPRLSVHSLKRECPSFWLLAQHLHVVDPQETIWARSQWLTSVILATQEAAIRRIVGQSQPPAKTLWDFFFFFAVWCLNLRPYTLSHFTSPFCDGFFWDRVSNYLPRVALNLDSPDLYLLSS
jgi:hypothetical protein